MSSPSPQTLRTDLRALVYLLIPALPLAAGDAEAQRQASAEADVDYKALTLAGYRMAEEESAKVSGGTAAPLPPGALRDNLALVRQNEAELGRLSRE